MSKNSKQRLYRTGAQILGSCSTLELSVWTHKYKHTNFLVLVTEMIYHQLQTQHNIPEHSDYYSSEKNTVFQGEGMANPETHTGGPGISCRITFQDIHEWQPWSSHSCRSKPEEASTRREGAIWSSKGQ